VRAFLLRNRTLRRHGEPLRGAGVGCIRRLPPRWSGARKNVSNSPEFMKNSPASTAAVPARSLARLPVPAPGSGEAIDPELLALPAPPRGRRILGAASIALAVTAALAMLSTLRADLAYFFAAREVVDLGEVTALDTRALEPGTFVRISGTPMASSTVHYQSLLGGTTYAVFPLAGQRDVFVRVAVDGADEEARAARRDFAGRLTTFGALGGRIGAVRNYLRDRLGLPVTSETYLLLADEAPGDDIGVLALAALCVGVIVLNVWLAVRWFRRAAPPLPSA
jgi:hypothetical protein